MRSLLAKDEVMRKRLLTGRFPRDIRHIDDLSELCIAPNVVHYLIEIFPILMFYMTFVTYTISWNSMKGLAGFGPPRPPGFEFRATQTGVGEGPGVTVPADGSVR